MKCLDCGCDIFFGTHVRCITCAVTMQARPPARDWKPVTGEDVWVKATVIRLRPEREGYVDVEIADHYYYADSGEVSDLEDPERVRLPLSSIRPMTGRDGGK